MQSTALGTVNEHITFIIIIIITANSLNLHQWHQGLGTMILSILRRKKLRHTHVKYLARCRSSIPEHMFVDPYAIMPPELQALLGGSIASN